MHERRRYSTKISEPPAHTNRQAPSTASKLPKRFLRRKRGRLIPPIEFGLWSSRALLLVVAGMYSTNYASVKYLETFCISPPCEHDPAEIAFCRFLVSALVCIPILYMNRKQLPLIKAGLECGLSVSINYVCQAEALEVIPAAKCCFIGTLTVATVPFLNAIFLGKPIRPMSLVSAAIAMIGVAVLENLIPIGLGEQFESASATTSGGTIFGIGKGDLLAMGQPIGFGYSVMRIDFYLEKYSHLPNRVLTITAAQCVAVCMTTFMWLLYDNSGRVPDLTYMLETHHLLALSWTGVVTSVGAIILQGTALQKASATDASLIFCTEPIIASLFAGWLLNEAPPASTYAGGAIITIACVIGSLSDRGTNDATAASRKKTLKSKTSNLSQDSLLPTRMLPGSNGSEKLKGDTSLPNLTDASL